MERETPRTDAFIATLPALLMNGSPLDLARQVRELMIAWSQFARTLEREIDAYENPVEEPRE